MSDDEKRLKHLEFIQGAISRMAANSFLLKAWTVPLVAGLFALSAVQADRKYLLVSVVPSIAFWILDAYYLHLERCLRALYDQVRQSNSAVDFSMKPLSISGENWFKTLLRPTLLIFYGSTIVLLSAIAYITR